MNEGGDAMLRECLVPQMPQRDEAATLLSQAADALLAGDHESARRYVLAADMPVLREFAYRWTVEWPKEHRRAQAAPTNPGVTGPKTEQYALTAATERPIYERDGYRCRYCGCRVVLKSARTAMKDLVPDAIIWSDSDKHWHGGFYALLACVDHLVPRARGGDNSPDNLVTACWPCNFSKMDSLIQDLGISDPRSRPPIVDGWDGLARMGNGR